MDQGPSLLFDLIVILSAAIISYVLILASLPLLQRYALARPNARSSHIIPTPQGGGIAIVIATLGVTLATTTFSGAGSVASLYPIIAGTILLACIGAIDDLRPMAVLPRLLLQFVAIAIVVETLPDQFRILSSIPVWAEHALLLIAALWFINLVNFMDGLDWMSVVEILPITVALAIFGVFAQLSAPVTTVALALAGAMIGFAPFNRPIAKLFLGDVGSLPIGLLTGWMLLELAERQHLVAALLLPLYYLIDATLTLILRALNGEKIWSAHRSHFYQRATDNGMSVLQIVALVFALNVALAIMAGISVILNQRAADATLFALGLTAVAATLWQFSRKRRTTPQG